MRCKVGRHPDRDSRTAINDEIGKLAWQNCGFVSGVVVVSNKIDGFFIDIRKHLRRSLGHASFGISHRCRRVAIDGTKVSLSVDHRLAHVEGLRHSNQSGVNHRFAVGVVISRSVSSHLGALSVLRAWSKIEIVHRHENAPLGWLQSIADIGQRPLDDHTHRVGEVRSLHLLFER